MFWDKRLPQDYENILMDIGSSPHCDPAVLHAPGECQVCDDYPKLQAYRLNAGINFTGHSVTAKAPCWAEVCRSTELIYRWPGNRMVKNAPAPGPRVGNG